MGARQRLNAAHVTGDAIVALVVGAATGSWLISLGAMALLLVADLHMRNIRPDRR